MYEELLESSEFYQKRYHNFSSKLILPVFALMVFLVVFLAFFKKEITLKSAATVEPVKVLAQVQSTSSNKIILNSLKENLVVNIGDVLIKYDSTNETLRQDNSEDQLSLLQKQKEQLELLKLSYETTTSQFPETDTFGYCRRFEDYWNQRQTLESSISQQNGTIASQNAASTNTQNTIGGLINELSGKISDYQALKSAISTGTSIDSTNQGYSVYTTYISQSGTLTSDIEKDNLKNQTITQIDSQIQQFQSELSSYQIQYSSAGVQQSYNSSLDSQLSSLQSQKISEVSQELTVLEQKINELENGLEVQNNTLSDTEIVSTVAGIVHMNNEVLNAELIPEGTLIAQIYPIIADEKKVLIETYIPSSDISSLKVGDKIKFKNEDSSNKELTLISKISSIDSNATKTETGSYFKVVSEVKLSDKETQALKYGTSGEIVVVTGEKTYLDYYLDKFLN
ncbi:TPA: bacteriocin secretion accessory protein [Streptococcus suis]|uniref:Transport protein ComB n=1 Tax=Streptococcus suis TaxID=1307 RepID=A0AAN2RFL2_STRSU|nr:bacteriocin secretion accessory protein [Streptococcus suis]NQH11105.1 bacteriocin secretion accessory protein [Streptococcus suis]NQH74475.1 bacteriocin secretion accessory protein [Streptococcus suis]NQI89230.1 bacteriocin secretion accessory protein [Streptococcus suis]NQI93888.1 bacteriocin secretion accessory protein [Streptococcus suis]NQJ01515.1 bacteriocin secretion accessory protein [Streptococcus suis]